MVKELQMPVASQPRPPRGKLASTARAALIACVAASVVGCAATAPEKSPNQQVFDRGWQRQDACRHEIAIKPDYTDLKLHMSLEGGTPTLASRTDDSVPTMNEARELLAWNNEMDGCLNEYTATFERIVPSVAKVMRANAADQKISMRI